MQISSLDSVSELRDYKKMAIKALQNIDISEELNTDYGSEYSSCNSERSKLGQLIYPGYFI